jgi:hypothetical protein
MKINKIIYLLNKTPFEEGIPHPAEEIVKELDFKKMYLGYFSNYLICEIIILFSRCLDLPIDIKKMILKRYLLSNSFEIKKEILKAFDLWKEKELIPIVEKYKDKEIDQFLKNYATEIILALNNY